MISVLVQYLMIPDTGIFIGAIPDDTRYWYWYQCIPTFNISFLLLLCSCHPVGFSLLLFPFTELDYFLVVVVREYIVQICS